MKKLVLKKEIIASLTASEQANVKGGTATGWDCVNRYLTGTLSHFDPANCINGYGNTDDSYCACHSADPGGCVSEVVLYGGCLITD